MCSWGERLATRSAASRFCSSSKLALLVLAAFPAILSGQLTTGVIAGLLRTADGQPAGGSQIVITGGAGFHAAIHTNAQGEFTLTLPYGLYQLDGVSLTVAPLSTTRVELTAGGSGIQPYPGLWTDATRGQVYPEALSLQGVLLAREPASVTEPLDFLDLSDNRLAVASQRAFSWTDTRYKLQGIDTTDSYQPGRPLMLPDVGALEEIAVRSGFAQTTSDAKGTEVGLFLKEPGASWHGALSTADTAPFLSSSNLPPPASRGLVQQPDQFRWLTRDGFEAGGPVTKWADLFASVAGQWSSQTVPLAAPGNDQNSRLLFANVRGRVRASTEDQIDAAYTGSRINFSNGGFPAGIEGFEGNRMMPSFVLPGGFPSESEADSFDSAQIGWTHELAEASGLGAIQVRYGYSAAHLNTNSVGGASESSIELLGGMVTGAPPLDNFAVRTRQSIEGAWQPAALRTASLRHQIVVGAGWTTSLSLNRFTSPDTDQITVNGTPTFVIRFTSLGPSRELVRSFSAYAVDRVTLTRSLSIDLGGLADFSRGSVPGQPGDLIEWNSLSPRAGFAWRVPHGHGLVFRGAYSRLYAPLAGRYLDFGDPNSLGGIEYRAANSNFDQLGAVVMRFGGPFSSIAPSLHRPYSDEFNVGAEMALPLKTFAGIQLFRRDTKDRIAAMDLGVPASAYTPVSILDPGPDGIAGTYDDRRITVYEQNPATFGQDRYLLTNPPGLRELNEGLLAQAHTGWRRLTLAASFVAEKSYGPTNPGNTVFENDPGVIGALYLDPNTSIHAAGRDFMDRAYVGKIQGAYRLPWGGIELASVANYMDGLVFARQLLVTGLAQGPFLIDTTVRGSPEGGNRAAYVFNWNLRAGRDFRLPTGKLTTSADVMNLTNAAHKIQENDLTGPAFNLRLPVAIQAPRMVRLALRWDF
jgi:hypothetical protein